MAVVLPPVLLAPCFDCAESLPSLALLIMTCPCVCLDLPGEEMAVCGVATGRVAEEAGGVWVMDWASGLLGRPSWVSSFK
jgi:hypothetical protein